MIVEEYEEEHIFRVRKRPIRLSQCDENVIFIYLHLLFK